MPPPLTCVPFPAKNDDKGGRYAALPVYTILPCFALLFELYTKFGTLPGKTGEGFTYCLNAEKYLRLFLDDGLIPIDNSASERAIRPFTVGRKNWQLIDTINGANASAIVYSIVETAKANSLKPYEYLRLLLTELPQRLDQKCSDLNLDDLLPWSSDLPDSCRKKSK